MAGEVTFMPSEADFVAAQRDYWRARGRRRLLLFLIFPAACALMGVVDSISGEGSLVWNLVGYSLAGAIMGGAAFLTCLLIIPASARRTYRQQRSLHKEFQYGWSEQGLSCRTKYGSALIPWHELHCWSDGGRTFLFYINDRLFHFLPHRALTPEEIADLRSTAGEFGPERRYLADPESRS